MKYKMLIGLFLLPAFPSFAELSENNTVSGKGFVYRVIDGDTYDINVDNQDVYNALKEESNRKGKQYLKDKYKSFRVRLANIDTAESKHPDQYRNSSKGQSTSDYVKNLIEKEKVFFECWDQGKYGRFICSVSFDGNDLGLQLIEEGYSNYVTKYGRHPYLDNEYKNAD